MMLFSERLKLEKEYREWVKKANLEIRGGRIDEHSVITVLAFLQEKGLLKESAKPVTCQECNKRYTFSCALYYGNVGDKHYFLARGGGFSCSWGEPRIERLTKGHLDGLSAKITTIDELHETENNEEGTNDEAQTD